MGFISDLLIEITSFRIRVGNKLNKLWEDIGNKANLTTTDKSNLVNAINEVNGNIPDVSNFLEKDTSNTITHDFEITNGFGTLRVGDYGALYGELTGISYIDVGTDDGFAVSYYMYDGTHFDATVSGIYGNNGNDWSLGNNNNVISRMVMPETGNTERVLTTGAKIGSTTYYADTQGIVVLPNYPSVSGFVPYTGASQAVDLNTKSFSIGGDFNKNFSNFERSQLHSSTTGTTHFTRLTDVASFSRGLDSTTQTDCVVITLPMVVSTHWAMEVDILVRNNNGMFKSTPTKLLISAYNTNNSFENVTAISGADNVKSVSFCRDGNNNTIVIIRPQDGVPTNFSFGRVNISNLYHSINYNVALAVKSNYKVEAVLESSLTGLTTNGTITNAQFTRDSYLWNKGDFNPAQYVLQTSLNTQLANYATKAGTQTFTGQNTFTQAPYIPAGTLDGHAVNLGQVNSLIAGVDQALGSYIKKGVNNVNPAGQPFSIHANYGTLDWNGNGFSFVTDSEQEFSYIEDEQAIGVNPFENYGFYLNNQRLRFSNAGNRSELLPSNGVSKSKLPVTGSTQRTLAVGAIMGGNTYYANENGIINLPNINPPVVDTTVKAYMPGEVVNNDTVSCNASKTIIYLSSTFTGPLNIAIDPELQDGAWLIVIHTYQGSGPGLFNINGSLIDITAQLTSTYQASQGKRYRFIYVKDLGRFALVDGGGIYQ